MEIIKKVQTILPILFEHRDEILMTFVLFCSIASIFYCIFKIRNYSKNVNYKANNNEPSRENSGIKK